MLTPLFSLSGCFLVLLLSLIFFVCAFPALLGQVLVLFLRKHFGIDLRKNAAGQRKETFSQTYQEPPREPHTSSGDKGKIIPKEEGTYVDFEEIP